jgi:hypothetical protein
VLPSRSDPQNHAIAQGIPFTWNKKATRAKMRGEFQRAIQKTKMPRLPVAALKFSNFMRPSLLGKEKRSSKQYEPLPDIQCVLE